MALDMRWIVEFGRCRSASVVSIFTFALPGVFLAIGVAVDGSNLVAQHTKVQAAADLAALSAAKEVRLANSDAAVIQQVATNFVNSNLMISGVEPPVDVRTAVPDDKTFVEITVSKQVPTYVLKIFGTSMQSVSATARARIRGGNPVCLIALDQKADQTLILTQDAKLTAPTCEIYSNSKNAKGLTVMMNATITAGAVCSAGGKYSNAGSIIPQPQLDCPVLSDPLVTRPRPSIPHVCDHTNLVVSSGSQTLYPGTYCGGMYITAAANVTLNPGEYFITNGPLMVDTGASLRGQGVGFFLAGAEASFYFDGLSTLDLSAPTAGPLAGLLIFQDRDVKVEVAPIDYPAGVKPPPKLPPTPKLGPGIPNLQKPVNQILSDNARNLLGTIYMPKGSLYIDANKPVADQSAYTIIVAQQIGIAAGPNLVLNSNYAATVVPVPQGLGLTGGSAFLVR